MAREDKPGPFTYRRRANSWEICIIVKGQFKAYVQARSERDAIALARWRYFHHRFLYPYVYNEPLDMAELEETVAVLQEYGFNASVVYRHYLRLLKSPQY